MIDDNKNAGELPPASAGTKPKPDDKEGLQQIAANISPEVYVGKVYQQVTVKVTSQSGNAGGFSIESSVAQVTIASWFGRPVRFRVQRVDIVWRPFECEHGGIKFRGGCRVFSFGMN